MPIRKIGSPHPGYLAATDILISDMSNINYDFLLFDRPIILLANEWLRKNFPDIGIKTGLADLEGAIKRSIENPSEYQEQRQLWHRKTMHMADGKSSQRVIEEVIKRSRFSKPFFIFLHGNNEVSKVHLLPLVEVLKASGKEFVFTGFYEEEKYKEQKEKIIISTHNNILNRLKEGYRVHIDHSVKGEGVTDYEKLADKYREMDYYSNTDLHITEGEISYENTKKLLGPYGDRVVMVGYPKSDTLLKCNNNRNREEVCRELRFRKDGILITYAPTGKYRYPFKQGASLNNDVLRELKLIAKRNNYNILIKLRSRESILGKIIKKIKSN